jgi:hypothetical protein
MRNTAIAILLLLGGALAPVQAGLLTRGNIFADSLAGCSLGVVVGFASSVLLTAPVPVAGTAAVAPVGVVGGCLTGVALVVAVQSAFHANDWVQDMLNSHRPLDTITTMVYPKTPGYPPDSVGHQASGAGR